MFFINNMTKSKVIKPKIYKTKKDKNNESMTVYQKFELLIKKDPFGLEHHIFEKSNKYNKLLKKAMLKEIGMSLITIRRVYGDLLMWVMHVIHTNKYYFNKKILLYVDVKNKKLNIELENIIEMDDKEKDILYDCYFVIIVEIYEIIVDYMRQMYGIVFPIFDEEIKHKNENVLNMIIISDFIIDLNLNTNNFEYEMCKTYYLSNEEKVKNINLLIFNLIKEELKRNIFYYYEQIFKSIGLSV